MSLNSLYHNLYTYFTHTWNISDVYHKGLIFLHDSMIRLELWIQEHHYPYNHLHAHEDFISDLQFSINIPFYPEDKGDEEGKSE